MAYASQSSLRLWWSPACRGPWSTLHLYGDGVVSVRPAIIESVSALNAVLEAYKYITRQADTGAYNCRVVTGGSTYSLHAYGIALDINWTTNGYGPNLVTDMFRNGDGRMPYRIEEIRTKNGAQVWRWGGLFPGNKDAMHYEITCAPSDIATGINWNTVYQLTPIPIPTPPPTIDIPKEDPDMIIISSPNYPTRLFTGATCSVVSPTEILDLTKKGIIGTVMSEKSYCYALAQALYTQGRTAEADVYNAKAAKL